MELVYELLDLPHGVLGATQIVDRDAFGRPAAATIQVDVDASGFGWGGNGYDLHTTLLHEVGHTIGFDPQVPAFAAAQSRNGNQWMMHVAGLELAFESNRSELDPDRHADAVMAGELSRETRKTLTPWDVEPVRNVWQSTEVFSDQTWSSSLMHLDGGGMPGFVFFAQEVADAIAAGPALGLTNADFDATDPNVDDFGWSAIGKIEVADGIATISEDVGMISGLSQTFVVPQGVNTITFTLGGISLDVGGGSHPPEAFEVSLLGAFSTESLLGEMTGMTGGDALFNLQADGTVLLSDDVQIAGAAQSGDVLSSFDEPIDVTLRLPQAAAGKTATLSFDLIGFGEDTSSVSLTDLNFDTRVLSWQNPRDRHDVDDSGDVTPFDALMVINELNRKRYHNPDDSVLFPISDTVGPPPFVDVSGDGTVTALDALHIINRLNRINRGHGESPPKSWQNPNLPADVDGSLDVRALDALMIINELNAQRIHDPLTKDLMEITDEIHPPPYYDVNGDGKLTAMDALLVIHELNRTSRGEGESHDLALLDVLHEPG